MKRVGKRAAMPAGWEHIPGWHPTWAIDLAARGLPCAPCDCEEGHGAHGPPWLFATLKLLLVRLRNEDAEAPLRAMASLYAAHSGVLAAVYLLNGVAAMAVAVDALWETPR